MMPKDPVILLSYINTQLRDFYPDLESLCKDKEADMEEIITKLEGISYQYDSKYNQFQSEA